MIFKWERYPEFAVIVNEKLVGMPLDYEAVFYICMMYVKWSGGAGLELSDNLSAAAAIHQIMLAEDVYFEDGVGKMYARDFKQTAVDYDKGVLLMKEVKVCKDEVF